MGSPVDAVVGNNVSNGVELPHCAGVKVTHLGHDGGFDRAADVDPGASGGDTCDGPKGRRRESDREAVGLLAKHCSAVPARAGGRAVWAATGTPVQARSVRGVPAHARRAGATAIDPRDGAVA